MNGYRILLSVLLLALAVSLAAAGSAAASNAIAGETSLACTACHDKPGSKLLTDKGKYYELMGGLEGYDEIEQAFGRCTTCHVRKPGSKKLTREGQRLARAISDMQSLKELVMREHPVAPAAEGAPGNPGDSAALTPGETPWPAMPAHAPAQSPAQSPAD
jgi:hypothetical protein